MPATFAHRPARRLPRAVTLAAVVPLCLGAAACSGADPRPDEPAATTAASESTAHDAAESTTVTQTATEDTRETEQLREVRERFDGLVPKSLFDAFDSCTPNGLEDSMECSGPKVGQFQFFASESKAASTTQVLTELRSSRIVEDKKDRVVGWSTLGNTAILTVVDNGRGLVVQQMAATDQVDPEDRIYELGLAEPPADWTPESAAQPTTGSRETDAEETEASTTARD